MISFRYHLVSIIAVFAALAVGIIAGSTVVKQSLLDSTKQNLERTERQLADMNDTNNQLTELVDRYEQFGEAAPERFLAGRLSGTPLLIVEGPGVADRVRNGIDDALAAAGAVVAGRVVLDASIDDDDAQQRLADTLKLPTAGPEQFRAALGQQVAQGIIDFGVGISSVRSEALAAEVAERATTTAPPTVTTEPDRGVSDPVAATASPSNAAGSTSASTESIVADSSTAAPPPAVTEPATTQPAPVFEPSKRLDSTRFDPLAAANLAQVRDLGDAFTPAAGLSVLVLTDRSNGADVADVLTALLLELEPAPLPVMVAEAGDVPSNDDSTSSSLVGLIRDSPALRAFVSTVDDADRFPGWLATVLTMQERNGGRVGQYGRHDGNRGPFPASP